MRSRSTNLSLAILSILILIVSSAVLAAPGHVWSKRYGKAPPDAGTGVAVDGAGNVIMVGGSSELDLGGGPLPVGPMIVVKYDPNGVYQWGKGFNAQALAVAVDGLGNVAVTGYCNGLDPIDFGGGPLTSFGYQDMFVVKFDADGIHQWSRRCGVSGWDASGWGIAMDGSGSVIVSGTFGGSVDFGGGALTSAGSLDVFLVKYTAAGICQWSKRFGGTGGDLRTVVVVDGYANVLVTGTFERSVDFGGGAINSNGGWDIFVAKYDPSGAHQWSKGFGSTSIDEAKGIAVDGSGNAVLTGHSLGPVDFGGGTISLGSWTCLVMLDPSGAHLWSRGFTATNGEAVAADTYGNVILTGHFGGTVDFGGGPLSSFGGVGADIFVAKFDAGGAHQWSQRFGSSSTQESGNGVAMDTFGSFAITGNFGSTVDFGGGPLTSGGSADIFIVKYSEQPVPVLFTHFVAVARGDVVDVKWDLWSDESLDGFSLLRRTDGSSQFAVVATGDPRATRSFTDASVKAGKTYSYEMVITAADGDAFRSPVATVTLPAVLTSVGPCYPNPFNPRTAIEYTLAEAMPVTIEILDVTGAIVARLEQGVRAAGAHRAEWHGRDSTGRLVGSGVYFYRLAGAPRIAAGKMTLLK